ncbi:MAG: DHH family phosphoesterase [Anaerolineales bacterium]
MEMKNRLKKIFEVLDGLTELLILPHNDPDPDAIASAVALQYLVREKLGIRARIAYRGIIGRSENKALVRYLEYPLEKLDPKEFDRHIPIALVDTQPGVGNNPLKDKNSATIVIDHHTYRETSGEVGFADVRPEIGATATILTEYIQATGLDFPGYLSTALFYGIKTDTMGLGRGASAEDVAAYLFLQPRVDVEALSQIERAQVPKSYFKSLTTALQATKIYDQDLVISDLGVMQYPDLGAEIGDLLLRLQGVVWVICLGIYKEDLILSVRSRSRQVGAGDIARRVIGNLGTAGGHGTMAGGQIRIRKLDPDQLTDQIIREALEYLKGDRSLTGKLLT